LARRRVGVLVRYRYKDKLQKGFWCVYMYTIIIHLRKLIGRGRAARHTHNDSVSIRAYAPSWHLSGENPGSSPGAPFALFIPPYMPTASMRNGLRGSAGDHASAQVLITCSAYHMPTYRMRITLRVRTTQPEAAPVTKQVKQARRLNANHSPHTYGPVQSHCSPGPAALGAASLCSCYGSHCSGTWAHITRATVSLM
jgi:hypothetical protein